MVEIKKYLTFDGQEHNSTEAANNHLDNLLGAIVDKVAQQVHDTQKIHPLKMLLFSFLQNHAAEVAQIEADRQLLTPDND